MDLRPSRHLPDLAGFWGCWPILGRLEEPFGDVGQVLLVVDSQDEVVAEDDLAPIVGNILKPFRLRSPHFRRKTLFRDFRDRKILVFEIFCSSSSAAQTAFVRGTKVGGR